MQICPPAAGPAVPNQRGLETASDPARIPAPNPSRLTVFLVVTLTMSWLASLPMIMDVVAKESTAGFFLVPPRTLSPS